MELKLISVVTIIFGVFIQELNCMNLEIENSDFEESYTMIIDNDLVSSKNINYPYWRNNNVETSLKVAKKLEQQINNITQGKGVSDPIIVDWKVLIEIKFKLKYLKEHDMEMYVPVFSKAVKAIHGKEVIIDGYVIPFDEDGKLLSLSYNPYASCYHCGKGSPASILSLYPKDKKKRYRIDDFRTFKGTIYLNYDDLDEFYYILRDAVETD